MVYVLFSLLALLISSIHTSDDWMYYQYAIGISFCCIPICIFLKKSLGLLFGVCSAYISTYSISIILNSHGRYVDYPGQFKDFILINSSSGFLIAIIFLISMLHVPPNIRSYLRASVPLYTVCNALYVINSARIGYRLGGGNGYTGFLDYAGMNASLIALGCAFLIPKASDLPANKIFRISGFLISICGIILSKSAIPFGIVGLILFSRVRHRALGIILTIAVGWITIGEKMIGSSDRFTAYRIFMAWLYRSKFLLFGTGLGSFSAFAPTVQIKSHFMMEMTRQGIKGWFWPWLHSDFLQCFFEFGVVGGGLIVSTYLYCLMRNIKINRDAELFSLGLGLGGCALLNYPCRYFSTAFLIAWYLVESLDLRVQPILVEMMDLTIAPQSFV